MKPFQNPIIYNSEKGNTADPYVIRHEGYYYHCYANRQGVYITKSQTLWGIGSGETVQVYDSEAEGALPDWYAPELHRVDGKWYIYASPDYGNNSHVMTALMREGDSPLGAYKNLGMIEGLENQWTIDGTLLYYQNERYFVWTRCQEMYIARMSSPCSITGKVTVLTKPEYPFETRAGLVNEGPAVLYRGNKIHVVYSANDSQKDAYCLGLLTFEVGNDILDIRNWRKRQSAVFEKTDAVFGPGHCSFTTVSENGEEMDYIVYHANLASGTGWGGRSVFAQPFSWDKNDAPVFGKPEL
ncbi:MAG: glycoside hydrolase family 43 protein [Clostridia bacterium]|nr:glycoside hydrolase family 43 protein [Clostridia bacterium]